MQNQIPRRPLSVAGFRVYKHRFAALGKERLYQTKRIALNSDGNALCCRCAR